MTILSIGSVANAITAFFEQPKHNNKAHKKVTSLEEPAANLSPYCDIIDYLYQKNGMVRLPYTPQHEKASQFWQYIHDCIEEGLLSWELLTDCPSLLSTGYIWLTATRVQALLEEQDLDYAEDYYQLAGFFMSHPAYSHQRIVASETSRYYTGDSERRLAYAMRANELKNTVNCSSINKKKEEDNDKR
ncbi:hypothetical protein [Faucicola atlantae]|uniref:Uncharacterized protein n=1 Tax=Faucicola atlantae TaxID=34059 RepID=A0A1B8QCV7_9GAMM|nr:hypothetical protein [Moraxella atlantae]OBX79148.1 hypothetical protein A9306_09050 [Moraxella atlantae]